MPLYEYYCKPCSSQFELLRPLSKMDEPATCPGGHVTNNRVLSLFAHPQRYGGQDQRPPRWPRCPAPTLVAARAAAAAAPAANASFLEARRAVIATALFVCLEEGL